MGVSVHSKSSELMMQALLAGFGLSLSLILAIGAQNAFVLRQGLMGRYVFIVCLFCALSDAVLILVGVFAMASIDSMLPNLAHLMRYGGALFLLFYGLSRFYSAYKLYGNHDNQAMDFLSQPQNISLKRIILTLFALTFLNPHVYIDTVLLLGTVANRYKPEHAMFAVGAVSASFVFFFALGYGAYLLRALFANSKAWLVLDSLIGVFMLYLAWQLWSFPP